MMLDRCMIRQCAPTLASIKTGSLFSCACPCTAALRREAEELNRQLEEKGVEIRFLRQGERSALVYVFRPKRLERDLSQPGAAELLRACGYGSAEPEAALARLRERLGEEGEFPHEIGLFLGYPLGDVLGFIRNRGRNCKCCGCWKVYGDEDSARRLFARYGHCRRAYERLWSQGRSLVQLTVSA